MAARVDQRNRRQQGNLGAQRDHHHLRRIRRSLRPCAAAHPQLWPRRAAAGARRSHPALLISPYARAHAVSHAEGDHNAVIETINALFGLPALSSPAGRSRRRLQAGNSPDVQRCWTGRVRAEISRPARRQFADHRQPALRVRQGPAQRRAPPLPAAYATIPDDIVNTLPHYGGKGCAAIGVTPEDVRQASRT